MPQVDPEDRFPDTNDPAEISEPSEDEIRTLAYFIWTERVFLGISADEKADWYQAEQFLRNGGRNPPQDANSSSDPSGETAVESDRT